MTDRSTPVIVEQHFDNSVSAVWKAVTERSQMIQWYFENIPDFQPVVGFETRFNVVAESREFLHIWKITETIPEQKIAYSWTFEGITGQSLVTFELSGDDDSCKLKLTSAGLENLPDDIPEFTRESCHAGWKHFIQDRLAEYMRSLT